MSKTASRLIAVEVTLVLALSLGQSAVYSVLSLWKTMTNPMPLIQQNTNLTGTYAQDRPWLDLAYQLAGIVFPMVPAFLALYLLHLAHGSAGRTIGWDATRMKSDLLRGLSWAAGIGIPGLGFYLLAVTFGFNTTVQPASLVSHWWSVPVYVGIAFMNGFLEEIVMLGYLGTRLTDLKWSVAAIIWFSAIIRGSYHLYQGFGGGLGNLVMGLIFGWYFMKTKRVAPLVWAHVIIDVVVFLGYPLALMWWPDLM